MWKWCDVFRLPLHDICLENMLLYNRHSRRKYFRVYRIIFMTQLKIALTVAIVLMPFLKHLWRRPNFQDTQERHSHGDLKRYWARDHPHHDFLIKNDDRKFFDIAGAYKNSRSFPWLRIRAQRPVRFASFAEIKIDFNFIMRSFIFFRRLSCSSNIFCIAKLKR